MLLFPVFELKLNCFDAHCCHMGTAIKHPVPDRVMPSFVIEKLQMAQDAL